MRFFVKNNQVLIGRGKREYRILQSRDMPGVYYYISYQDWRVNIGSKHKEEIDRLFDMAAIPGLPQELMAETK